MILPLWKSARDHRFAAYAKSRWADSPFQGTWDTLPNIFRTGNNGLCQYPLPQKVPAKNFALPGLLCS
jgi:hypothetical protein